MSRWWYLAVFAPVLNLWVGYRCVACPSGYAHHKKMDVPGIALAALYWIAMLAGAFILASLFSSLSGSSWETASVVDQVRNTLRAAITTYARR